MYAIRSYYDGTDIKPLWDGREDYQLTVIENGMTEVKTTLSLAHAEGVPTLFDVA